MCRRSSNMSGKPFNIRTLVANKSALHKNILRATIQSTGFAVCHCVLVMNISGKQWFYRRLRFRSGINLTTPMYMKYCCLWLLILKTLTLLYDTKFYNSKEFQQLTCVNCSPPVFSEIRVIRSLVLYVCFVDRCLSFCAFSFGHCVVCSSSIYGF